MQGKNEIVQNKILQILQRPSNDCNLQIYVIISYPEIVLPCVVIKTLDFISDSYKEVCMRLSCHVCVKRERNYVK